MKKNKGNISIKDWFLNLIGIKHFFKQMPYLIFLAVLGVVYIYNVHQAERVMRDIQTLEKENKVLRWKYVAAKSKLMFNSTQSQTAGKVDELGLGYKGDHLKRIVMKDNN